MLRRFRAGCNRTGDVMRTLPLLAALLLTSAPAWADGKVRLFILSGQSNMVRFDPNATFTPALKKAFPGDEILIVKSAEGGQPIARWYKGAGQRGDLYDLLLSKVNAA